ncbi:hypothetical protein ALC53_00446 [Atta colombica]|uniref:Uncharacterized protein n=1 Tax=Atta colombica TaxID=520822 RepID=A0A195BY91_9HYME|nr:hypothetical protein ALC53_00446 [Atta colombica]
MPKQSRNFANRAIYPRNRGRLYIMPPIETLRAYAACGKNRITRRVYDEKYAKKTGKNDNFDRRRTLTYSAVSSGREMRNKSSLISGKGYSGINEEIIWISIGMGITIAILITIALCYIAREKCRKRHEGYYTS